MSKLFKSFMTVAAFAALTIVSSCTKTCDEGFEGDKCDTEIRAKFIGDYDVSETKNGGSAYTYSTEITSSAGGALQVNITKIATGGASTSLFNTSVKATVDGNAINITDQEPDSDGYSIQGNGSISNGVISLTYTVTGPVAGINVTDSYVATLSPQ